MRSSDWTLTTPGCRATAMERVFDFFKADIADKGSLPTEIRSAEVLVHCAALVRRRQKHFSRLDYFRINTGGTDSVLSRLDPNRLSQVIFLSTVSLYGSAAAEGIPDEQTPASPQDFYGESKAAAEDVIRSFSRFHSIPYTIFQLTPVYGRTFLLNLRQRVCLPQRLGFFRVAAGRQRLSLCSIHNVVEALGEALNNARYFQETVILKDPVDYSVIEIIGELKTILARERWPVFPIPRQIPEAVFKWLGLIMPARANALTYRWHKVARDAVYSGAKMMAMNIPLRWDLRTTLRTPEHCPFRIEAL